MILTVKALVVALLLGFSLLLLGLGLGMPIPGVAAMAAEAVLGLLLPPAAFPLFMAGAVCMLCLRPIQGGGNSVTAKTRRCYIMATSGPLQGRSYPLTEQTPQLTIGREGCSVLFPPSTPGVGRHHCRVYLTGGSACLEDENSTYGTFLLPDGRKLMPDTPVTLTNGMRFCLASPAVTFQYTETVQ